MEIGHQLIHMYICGLKEMILRKIFVVGDNIYIFWQNKISGILYNCIAGIQRYEENKRDLVCRGSLGHICCNRIFGFLTGVILVE